MNISDRAGEKEKAFGWGDGLGIGIFRWRLIAQLIKYDKMDLGIIGYPLPIMDETRAQAYANLIQQLLTCANGEESQVLQANLELVDAGFVGCEDDLGVTTEGNKRGSSRQKLINRI